MDAPRHVVMTDIPWLPPLVLFEEFDGNWRRYADHIYSIYISDFAENAPFFRNFRVGRKKQPIMAY